MLWLRTHVGFDGWRLDFVKVRQKRERVQWSLLGACSGVQDHVLLPKHCAVTCRLLLNMCLLPPAACRASTAPM